MFLQKNIRYLILLLVLITGLGAIFLTKTSTNSQNKYLDGKYDTSKKIAYFNGQKFDVPQEYREANVNILGSKSEKEEKRIEIDLSAQKLYAYENTDKIYSFDVSTGKWNLTPTGEFRIWTKIKYTLMTGGSKELGTYYYLPNVPFTMFFYKDYGIHGAYWHDNFGHPMSHGCVNMRIEDAEKLFYWANPVLPENEYSILSSADNQGTRVIIYGETPKE